MDAFGISHEVGMDSEVPWLPNHPIQGVMYPLLCRFSCSAPLTCTLILLFASLAITARMGRNLSVGGYATQLQIRAGPGQFHGFEIL